MKQKTTIFAVACVVGWAIALAGCRPDADDFAGQAEQLEKAPHRQNAIYNIDKVYTARLGAHKGDRSAPEVREVADATVEPLVNVYVDHPEDTRNGVAVIDLLLKMQDPRALPALLQALDWRQEVTEDHAIRAARAIQVIEVPSDEKAKVVQALSAALKKVSDSRPVDQQMRQEFVEALGSLDSPAAVPVLMEVATDQGGSQQFSINRLAAMQLGEIGDPQAIPALIKGLFLFAPNRPQMRMNDVAGAALVVMGKPAYEPVMKVLKGEHEVANQIAKQYIAAVRKRAPAIANQMSVEQETSKEATYVLGQLGFPQALDPIIKETQSDDPTRRANAAVALVSLHVKPADRGKVRDAVKDVYDKAALDAKPKLLVAMRHLYDPAVLPVLLSEASNSKIPNPDVRFLAAEGYALLADAQEAGAMLAMIRKEPPSEEGGYRENFQKYEAALKAANECKDKLACWTGKLEDSNDLVAQKAAYMVGRYGMGNSRAIAALIEQLDRPSLEVRVSALTALDHIATKGSPEAVAVIHELEEKEAGQSLGKKFMAKARPVQARLRAKTQ